MPGYLELPRPLQLLRTVGWNAAESFGFPVGGYAIGAWLAGRNTGLWVMLAAIWVTAVIRKLVTGRIPSLVTISLVVLTVQTAVAIATGNLWIFLVHFPAANFGLCILFARTARGHSPLAARLAAEMTGPPARPPSSPACTAFSSMSPCYGPAFSCCWQQPWRSCSRPFRSAHTY